MDPKTYERNQAVKNLLSDFNRHEQEFMRAQQMEQPDFARFHEANRYSVGLRIRELAAATGTN